MIIFIVDVHEPNIPISCKEIHYSPVPRVGEVVIADRVMYQVKAVYHNLDLEEIKLVTERV